MIEPSILGTFAIIALTFGYAPVLIAVVHLYQKQKANDSLLRSLRCSAYDIRHELDQHITESNRYLPALERPVTVDEFCRSHDDLSKRLQLVESRLNAHFGGPLR